MKRLLFDTSAFLWWLESDRPRLSPDVANEIADSGNVVYVSVVNAWEIAIKISVGKLDMKRKVSDLVEHYGFSLLPVLLPHAMAVEHLPLHHRDPFDRMLIAQAKVEGLTLITTDPHMLRYDVPVLAG